MKKFFLLFSVLFFVLISCDLGNNSTSTTSTSTTTTNPPLIVEDPPAIEYFKLKFDDRTTDPIVTWSVKNVSFIDITIDDEHVYKKEDVIRDVTGDVKWDKLKEVGDHLVKLVAANEIDTVKKSFYHFSGPLVDPDVDLPVIDCFEPEFYLGEPYQPPKIFWSTKNALSVEIKIDDKTVYSGGDATGDMKFSELKPLGEYLVTLNVYNVIGMSTRNFIYYSEYLTDEFLLPPVICYFYPKYYSGKPTEVSEIHWKTERSSSIDIFVDGKSVFSSQEKSGSCKLQELAVVGPHLVELYAHNVTDDAYAYFTYRCKSKIDE